MRYGLIFVFVLAWAASSSAQDSLVKKKKFQYGGMQQLGLQAGQNGTRSLFCITNGVRYKKFFVGIGADINLNRNYYFYDNRRENVAFFLDTRYYINKKKNFFGKVNGGVNLVTRKSYNAYGYEFKNLPGGYAAVGLGFKARLGKETFYSFDVNYCFRQTRYNQSYRNNWTNQWQTDKYDVRNFMILVNMGLEIF